MMTGFAHDFVRFEDLEELREADHRLHQEYHRFKPLGAKEKHNISEFLRRASVTGEVIYDEKERETAQRIINYWCGRMTSKKINLVAYHPPPVTNGQGPYRGLEAFREEASRFFFGRKDLAAKAIAQLAQSRLLEVIGPSGSGKSSFVLAGMLPQLRQGAISGSQSWEYLLIVPGSQPLRSLARAMQPLSSERDPDEWEGEWEKKLRESPKALAAELARRGKPTVLIVDQFEEIFTLCLDERARRAFAANIWVLTHIRDRKNFVILTRRRDFERQEIWMPEFRHHFRPTRFDMIPLRVDELRAAIEEPAKMTGVHFEPKVVDDLISQFEGRADLLPLLQFTLLQLWEQRDGNLITWREYMELGGGLQALPHAANAFLASKSPQEQSAIRHVLLRMVRLSEGQEVTGNRVRKAALYVGDYNPERIDQALEQLVAARLVKLTRGAYEGDDQVEVAHEALLRNWNLLERWINEERPHLEALFQLSAAARQWRAAHYDEGGLWNDGPILRAAEQFARREDLSLDESAFLDASRGAVTRRIREQEEARQRELKQARALAEARQRELDQTLKREDAERARAEAERARAEEERARANQEAQSARQQRRLIRILTVVAIITVGSLLVAGLNGLTLRALQTQAATAQVQLDSVNADLKRSTVELGTLRNREISVNKTATEVSLLRASVAGEIARASGIAADAVRSATAIAVQRDTAIILRNTANTERAQAEQIASAGIVTATTLVGVAQTESTSAVANARATARAVDDARATMQSEGAALAQTNTPLQAAAQNARTSIAAAEALPTSETSVAKREAAAAQREATLATRDALAAEREAVVARRESANQCVQASLGQTQTAVAQTLMSVAQTQTVIARPRSSLLTSTPTPRPTPTAYSTPTPCVTATPLQEPQ